ncbi:hypothetical protein RJ639_037319 [Escallonia herrerae]|uniref:Uncharacterized protein n=1 Tax=Escallonia herrerae TaxID=1293975 RepID=A0AA88WP47_9ASTE|nr:hypothetical protein RJ639_037319 [Escallonia herrerae]
MPSSKLLGEGVAAVIPVVMNHYSDTGGDEATTLADIGGVATTTVVVTKRQQGVEVSGRRGPGLVFLSLLALDIASRWLQMYSTFLVGKASHKDVNDSTNWLFKAYYGNNMFMVLSASLIQAQNLGTTQGIKPAGTTSAINYLLL